MSRFNPSTPGGRGVTPGGPRSGPPEGAPPQGRPPRGPRPDRGDRPDRGERQRPERKFVPDIWPSYLHDGYFDPEGNLRIEYVSRERVEPLAREMADDHPPLNTGELRRFFQYCRALESQLKTGRAQWWQLRDKFLLLDAAAQESYGKFPRSVGALFFDFIRRNVAAVKTEADFLRGFMPHFEALLGFASLYIRREGI